MEVMLQRQARAGSHQAEAAPARGTQRSKAIKTSIPQWGGVRGPKTLASSLYRENRPLFSLNINSWKECVLGDKCWGTATLAARRQWAPTGMRGADLALGDAAETPPDLRPPGLLDHQGQGLGVLQERTGCREGGGQLGSGHSQPHPGPRTSQSPGLYRLHEGLNCREV